MKLRQNLYLDRSVCDALDALARRPGGNKSRIASDLLAEALARRGTKQIDDHFKLRLDRMSREVGACRRDLGVLLEALMLFVRYQLTVTAPLPEADKAMLAAGYERFDRFIAQLGRQIAAGKTAIPPADDELPQRDAVSAEPIA